VAGAYRQRVFGNRDEESSISPSSLPDVRRTGQRYGAESGGGIENLFATWYGRPAPDLYGRVTAGYLERGFAGVSSEVLWKPVDSRLALGAELNYTIARDFDMGFGFRPACSNADCTTFEDNDYDVVTGHLSAYYDFDKGSFDKGIRIEVPLDAIFGTPTRDNAATTLSSLTRDGGARVEIDGRLYDVVEGGHRGQMTDSWGRFWR